MEILNLSDNSRAKMELSLCIEETSNDLSSRYGLVVDGYEEKVKKFGGAWNFYTPHWTATLS